MPIFHDMADKTADAGGPGFQTIAVREVRAPHPLVPDSNVPAYEMEIAFDANEAVQLLGGARLRICLMASRIIPIHVDIVGDVAVAPVTNPIVAELKRNAEARAAFPVAEGVDPVRPIICNCGKPRAASDVSWGHGIAYCSECLPF